MLKRPLATGHAALRGLLTSIGALAIAAPACAEQEAGCRIEFRNHFVRADFAYHVNGSSYLLAYYDDQRYDSMTDVHNVDTCDKIASGTSAKSPFESTLKQKGYLFKPLAIGRQTQEIFQAGPGYIATIQPESAKVVTLWTNNFLIPASPNTPQRLAMLCKTDWHADSARAQIESNLARLSRAPQACRAEITAANAGLLALEQKIERQDWMAVTTWKQAEAFIAKYTAKDVAQLLPEAQRRLQELRTAELSAMRAMPLNTLEARYRNETAQMTDEMLKASRERLIHDSLAEHTFSGNMRAYRITDDIALVAAAQHQASTQDERLLLEQTAIRHAAAPSRFFDVALKARAGTPSKSEEQHMGVFALYSMYGHIPVTANIEVTRAANGPGKVVLGTYRITLQLELRHERRNMRQSSWLGNADERVQRSVSREVTVILRPSDQRATVTADFGNLEAVRIKRGSQGGLDQEYISSDPKITCRITKVEAI